MTTDLHYAQIVVKKDFACGAMEPVCAPCKTIGMLPRLAELRDRSRLTLEGIAGELDVAISTVSRWESGETNIPTKRFTEIASAYRCTIAEIFGEELRPRLPQKAANDEETAEVRRVDLGYAMGPGTNIDDYVEDGTVRFDLAWLQAITRAHTDMLFVARGDGDSMTPTLINDDTVLIDTSQRDLNLQDRIWAVSVYGAGMIKRLRKVGQKRVAVMSDNKDVPPQEVDMADLHIVGRVVWVGRRV